jgi:hypothetical protein
VYINKTVTRRITNNVTMVFNCEADGEEGATFMRVIIASPCPGGWPGYFGDAVFTLGIQNAISAAAINATAPPKINGADGPKPPHAPTPCHSTPAITEAGKARRPRIAL